MLHGGTERTVPARLHKAQLRNRAAFLLHQGFFQAAGPGAWSMNLKRAAAASWAASCQAKIALRDSSGMLLSLRHCLNAARGLTALQLPYPLADLFG